MEHCITPHEREMLIRYCARFTQDWSIAEDLTQQTLLEVWHKSDWLPIREGRNSWLIGFARNVCLRWTRQRKQEQTYLANTYDLSYEGSYDLEDEVDLEENYERRELSQFVEKAVATLPTQTRQVLEQYYLDDIPQATVAARLGISVGAVEARLNRGKQALRRLLTHELRGEAESLGLVSSRLTTWQETRIWCPTCGQRHLQAQIPEAPGTVAFRCPGCDDDPEAIGWAYPLSNAHLVQCVNGLTQPKAILRRFMAWAHDYYYQAALHHGRVACAQCGQQRSLQLVRPALLSVRKNESEERAGLNGACPFCGWQDFCSPTGLLQGLPIVQHFWQNHPRMHMILREPLAEVAGTSAIVASFESMAGAARLDILLAQETLTLLEYHTNVLIKRKKAC